jgi:hypothetical protein
VPQNTAQFCGFNTVTGFDGSLLISEAAAPSKAIGMLNLKGQILSSQNRLSFQSVGSHNSRQISVAGPGGRKV